MKKTESFVAFRHFLQDEFVRRIGVNPSYSLRGYARFLNIDHSTLSKILDGKLKITIKRFESLSSKFNLTFEQLKQFNEIAVSPIDENRFKIISEWYHFAILELIKTNQFQSSSSWIAKRLSISVNEVNFSIKRLLELGFIKKNENNEFELLAPNNNVKGDDSQVLSHAHRGLQKQVIEKSLETLNTVSPKEKENSSLTVSCSRDLMPDIKEKIEKFKWELDQYIMEQGKHDDVYQLNIAFFPLTEKLVSQGDYNEN